MVWGSLEVHPRDAVLPVAERILHFKAQQIRCSWEVELCLISCLVQKFEQRNK